MSEQEQEKQIVTETAEKTVFPSTPKYILTSNQAATQVPKTKEESYFKYLDKLQLPWSEKRWNLYVSNSKSTVEIWGRLIGPDYSVSSTSRTKNYPYT